MHVIITYPHVAACRWVVDATRKGGAARFINHSCDPNCKTKIIVVDGRKHVCIYCKRRIEPGEELCYDYKVGAVQGVCDVLGREGALLQLRRCGGMLLGLPCRGAAPRGVRPGVVKLE
jgi:hypothetical protein